MWRWWNLGWVLLCVGCGGDSDTRVCFSTGDFCDGFLTANRQPDARIDAPGTVASGDTVVLDAGDSRDSDGRIDSYSWTQSDGPAVLITGADTELASFVAPEVDEAVTLSFRLTVTDNDDAADSAGVSVVVEPRSSAAIITGLGLLLKHLKPMALGGPSIAALQSGDVVQPVSNGTHAAYEGLWLSMLASMQQQPDAPLSDTQREDQVRVLLNSLQLRSDLVMGEPAVGCLVQQGLTDVRNAWHGRAPDLLAGIETLRQPSSTEEKPSAISQGCAALRNSLFRQDRTGTEVQPWTSCCERMNDAAVDLLLGLRKRDPGQVILDGVEIASAIRILMVADDELCPLDHLATDCLPRS